MGGNEGGRLSQAGRAGRIGGRTVYRGRVFDVHLDRVRFPDGSEGELEILRHPGAAAVLPIYRPGDRPGVGGAAAVVLLRQFRYAAGGEIWEIPAGKLEEGEDPKACARRELEEEAGLRAGTLRRLTTIHTTPGFTDERIRLFAAFDLESGRASRSATEFIRSRVVPLEEAAAMVRTGEITDGKTICALLHALAFDEEVRAMRAEV